MPTYQDVLDQLYQRLLGEGRTQEAAAVSWALREIEALNPLEPGTPVTIPEMGEKLDGSSIEIIKGPFYQVSIDGHYTSTYHRNQLAIKDRA